MQDFHCSHIKNKYGDKADTHTDTDGLMYKIKA